MSSNKYRDSQWTDSLNDIRKYFDSQQGPPNPYNLSYDVPANDTINVADSVVNTTTNTGNFLIDTAKIDFSDMG